MRTRRTVVREADWVDAIGIARIVKTNSDGKHEFTHHTARKLFKMALALLRVEDLLVERKP